MSGKVKLNMSVHAEKRNYKVQVKGKVQGVSYRFSAHAVALRLGLYGYVKNLPNGDVFMEIEGAEVQINKMIDWCQVGPPLAKVTEVEATEDQVKNFHSFEIKR